MKKSGSVVEEFLEELLANDIIEEIFGARNHI